MPLSPEARFQIARAEQRLAQRREREQRLLAAAQRVAAVLKDEFGAHRVILFGSLGRAWFHEESDVDLAVEGMELERLGAAWDRAIEIVGSNVDLIALEEAEPRFLNHVRQTGREL